MSELYDRNRPEAEALPGMTQLDADRQLALEGPNELPAQGGRTGLRIVADVLREPMFMLLLAAGGVYLTVGDIGEAIALLAFACLSVAIAVVQEGRSERVLAALRELSSPRALVIRDGRRKRIPGREVVRGDVLVLGEGDRVPADSCLLEGRNVLLDESLLTGESAPVPKRPGGVDTAGVLEGLRAGADTPHLFCGTLMVRGSGLAVVTATGARSELGKIGRAVSTIEREQPRLQEQTRKAVYAFAALGLSLSVAMVLLYGMRYGAWTDAILAGIALGMSLLPEEFPLVLTVFMVMGAWRLSRTRVLTRRAAAIETLGSATVLCTDKTGTLTQNVMTVGRLCGSTERWQREDGPARIATSTQLQSLLQTACMASADGGLEPMDRALFDLSSTVALKQSRVVRLVHEYPLSAQLLAVTRVWEVEGAILAAAKGAPEAIMELCRLSSSEHTAITAQVNELAREGMRVLGVASTTGSLVALPSTPRAWQFTFRGLIAFSDPLRETVPEAVRQCHAAGIRIVMITGDYPETALAIARDAGISAGELLAGEDVQALSDEQLASRLRTANLFARISPVQKLRIVQALKANGEIVAMTGDGVNDAPALKSAHIGVAMGGRGTDVAREAAAIVLLDDDFGSIVRAVRLGRRIHDNLRKAFGYILAIHVPIAGMALLPIALGLPLLLTPMLVAFLELIIDPACSIVFEAQEEEADVMSRPPRPATQALLSAGLIKWSVLQGVLGLGASVVVVLMALSRGVGEEELRTVAFVMLVGVNIALIFVNRTFSATLRATFGLRNASLWTGLGIAVGTLSVILIWPDARALLGLGQLHMVELLLCLAVVIGLLFALERAKSVRIPPLSTWSG